jgi:hypothetical protein
MCISNVKAPHATIRQDRSKIDRPVPFSAIGSVNPLVAIRD